MNGNSIYNVKSLSFASWLAIPTLEFNDYYQSTDNSENRFVSNYDLFDRITHIFFRAVHKVSFEKVFTSQCYIVTSVLNVELVYESNFGQYYKNFKRLC